MNDLAKKINVHGYNGKTYILQQCGSTTEVYKKETIKELKFNRSRPFSYK